MSSKTIANGILRAIGILLGFFLLGYFLYTIQSVIIYIVIAAVVSIIGRPIIIFLINKLKFPNTLAVVTTMIMMLGVLTGIILLFIPLVVEQGKSLSLLEVKDLEVNLEAIFNQISAYFDARGISLTDQIKSLDIASQFQSIPTFFNSVVSTVGSLSIGLFSVLFISFFFMKDSKLLKNGILVMIPDGKETRFSKSLETINDLLARYFIGLIIQITILFIFYTIILLSFGISNPIVIAFLCALMNLIPYIGPLIGAMVMFILSMTSNIGLDFQQQMLPTSLWILFFYGLAQIFDNFVSQPKIFATATKSHPLEIFLIIIIGGLLFGIIGMIIAVPAYTALKVILKEFLSDNKIVKSITKDI